MFKYIYTFPKVSFNISELERRYCEYLKTGFSNTLFKNTSLLLYLIE